MTKKPANTITHVQRNVSEYHRDFDWEVVNMFTVASLDEIPTDTDKTRYKRLLSVYTNDNDKTFYRVSGVVNNYYQGKHKYNFWSEIINKRGLRFVVCELEAITYTLPAKGVPTKLQLGAYVNLPTKTSVAAVSGASLRAADAIVEDTVGVVTGTQMVVKSLSADMVSVQLEKQIYVELADSSEIMPITLMGDLTMRELITLFDKACRHRLTMELSVVNITPAIEMYTVPHDVNLPDEVNERAMEVKCSYLFRNPKGKGMSQSAIAEMEERYPDGTLRKLEVVYHDDKTNKVYVKVIDETKAESYLWFKWTQPGYSEFAQFQSGARFQNDYFIIYHAVTPQPTATVAAKNGQFIPVWHQQPKVNTTHRYIGQQIDTTGDANIIKKLEKSTYFPGVVWQQVTSVGDDGRVLLATGDIIDGMEDARAALMQGLLQLLQNKPNSITGIYVAVMAMPRNP